jgi:hypothetical protein
VADDIEPSEGGGLRISRGGRGELSEGFGLLEEGRIQIVSDLRGGRCVGIGRQGVGIGVSEDEVAGDEEIPGTKAGAAGEAGAIDEGAVAARGILDGPIGGLAIQDAVGAGKSEIPRAGEVSGRGAADDDMVAGQGKGAGIAVIVAKTKFSHAVTPGGRT